MSRQNNALPQMVEPLWSTYIHQKGARLGLPVTGTFELTPRCNFNCNMCYVHQTEAQAARAAAPGDLPLFRGPSPVSYTHLTLPTTERV